MVVLHSSNVLKHLPLLLIVTKQCGTIVRLATSNQNLMVQGFCEMLYAHCRVFPTVGGWLGKSPPPLLAKNLLFSPI